MNDAAPVVKMIAIDQINILNRRSRNQIVFKSIVSNIADLGLKKPITVSRRAEPVDGKVYDLVCGQGRLEAFLALHQTDIPAIVIDAAREECYLMSLVENIARRNHSPIELLREVSSLSARGYRARQIASKVNLAKSYVVGILNLLKNGEERLLYAVEKGRIPMSVAVEIANSDEAGVQRALCEAYEDRALRGRKLQTVRRIIELRKNKGKGLASDSNSKDTGVPSAESMVRAYRQEADRQQLLVKKARLTEGRLLFVVSALRKLFGDENFVTLLRAEGLDSLPAYLAGRIHHTEGTKI
jgi:ParB family transcriptional regulator, chromosome partitioning protein